MTERDKNLPTKKQKELLNFIDNFIKGSGYAPSYREIMRALDYKSVSTVATHIDGLIARGFLVKRDGSARSLEVAVERHATEPVASDYHQQWLARRLATLLKNSQLEKRERQALETAWRLLLPDDSMSLHSSKKIEALD